MTSPPMRAPSLTVATLDRRRRDVAAELRDLCRMHSRVVDLTVGMPDDGPRTLWATPQYGTLVIRSAEPVTAARMPAGYATSVSARQWQAPDRPGRWRMVAVLNPGHHTKRDRPTLAHPDRKAKDGPPRLIEDPVGQAAWLARRLAAGGPNGPGADPDEVAKILDYRVTRRWVAQGRHREGRTVTVRCVAVAATVDVRDPATVAASVVGGVGIDKTWGCGLTVWEPDR